MNLLEDQLYHIYNQGNNRQAIFNNRNDYLQFLKMVRQKIYPICEIICYCLMPNHYHFLVQTRTDSTHKIKLGAIEISALSNGFRLLNSGYCTFFNKKYFKSGSLFRQKTKAKLLERSSSKTDYPFVCFQYIHQNPIKKSLVNKMEDWEFSSFRDYADLREGTLINRKVAIELVGIDATTFYKESYGVIPENTIQNLFEKP